MTYIMDEFDMPKWDKPPMRDGRETKLAFVLDGSDFITMNLTHREECPSESHLVSAIRAFLLCESCKEKAYYGSLADPQVAAFPGRRDALAESHAELCAALEWALPFVQDAKISFGQAVRDEHAKALYEAKVLIRKAREL